MKSHCWKKFQDQKNKTSFRDHVYCTTSGTHRRGLISIWSIRGWSELVSMRNTKICT